MEKSEEYWKGDQVEIYEHKQRLVVPKKDEMLDIIVKLFPYSSDEKIKVLDIGAGKGALTERILDRFPNSKVTCLDSSQEMLKDARNRLSEFKDRVNYEQSDFNDADWNRSFSNEFEVIASALALHYLKPRGRKRFFQQCYTIIEDDGCFINGTGFKSDDPRIQQIYDDFHAKYIQDQLRKLEGTELTIEEIDRKRKEHRERAGSNSYSVKEQIALLRDSGFERAECVWKYFNMAVVIGLK